jgi:hypothetical protein
MPATSIGSCGLAKAENICVISHGPIIIDRPFTAPIAPWSSPCAFAGSVRDMIPCSDGRVKPASAPIGMSAYIIHPLVANA